MENFRNAAKAFIVNGNKLLMLKRRAADPHRPGHWDIPGGRLDLGEDPFLGLKREVREEITCDIEIVMPISVHHFFRDDGQKITLTIFWCKLSTHNISLSEEHSEFKWIEFGSSEIPEFFQPAIHNFQTYIRHNDY